MFSLKFYFLEEYDLRELKCISPPKKNFCHHLLNPNVIPNLYDFLASVKQIIIIIKKNIYIYIYPGRSFQCNGSKKELWQFHKIS